MQIRVGSTDSSDLAIKSISNGKGLSLINLVGELDDELIKSIILKHLDPFIIESFNSEIIYNGADEWVIQSRCEALLEIVLSEIALTKEK